jgi:hypothetical protein
MDSENVSKKSLKFNTAALWLKIKNIRIPLSLFAANLERLVIKKRATVLPSPFWMLQKNLFNLFLDSPNRPI